MKVKYRLGVKSYSGKVDGLVYANFASRNVVIGKMQSVGRPATEQNILLGNRSRMIAQIYKEVASDFKKDLELYTYRLYNLEEYQDRIAGNKYSTFCKLIWSAMGNSENPLNIEDVIHNGLTLNNCSQIRTVKTAVNNEYLPVVAGYEELTAEIVNE